MGGKYYYLVVLLVVAFLALGGYVFFRYRGQGESLTNNLGGTEEVVHSTIEISSQIEKYNPTITKKDKERLVGYLGEINFWSGGIGIGGITKVSKVEIVLTSEEQPQSTVTYRDKKEDEYYEQYKSSLSVSGEVGTLLVYISPNTGENPIYLGRYILFTLYKIASWPREQFGIGSEVYQRERSDFASTFINDHGGFIVFED